MKNPLWLVVLALLCVPCAAAAGDAQGEAAPLVYVNARCGLKVNAPPGWIVYQGMRKHREILAVFSRLPYESRDADNPRIVLMKQKAVRRGPDSAIAKAYRDAEVLGLMKNLPGIESVELLEAPDPGEENAAVFSRFSFELARRLKNTLVRSRTQEYIFFRDGTFYVLLCGADPGSFDKYRADFDAVAKSLMCRDVLVDKD